MFEALELQVRIAKLTCLETFEKEYETYYNSLDDYFEEFRKIEKSLKKDICFAQYLVDEKSYGKITDYCQTIVEQCLKSNTNFHQKLKVPSETLDVRFDETICDKVDQLLAESYQFSKNTNVELHVDKDWLDISKCWFCPHWDTKNLSANHPIIWKECGVFKPIDLFESFLKNYRYANSGDMKILKQRKLQENELVSTQNQLKIDGVRSYYMIDEAWVKAWEDYSSNRVSEYNLQTKQDFSEVPIVPHPGEISNQNLFEYSQNPESQDKYTEYRILNPHLWSTFYRTYGGGPKLHRDRGYIHSNPVLEDTLELEFEKEINTIKNSQNIKFDTPQKGKLNSK